MCVCEWDRARAQRERERERGRRESPLPATHELRLRRRPRDFAPRTQSFDFESHHEPRASTSNHTHWLRRRTQRPGSSFDFDFVGTDHTDRIKFQLRNSWVLMNLTGFDEFFWLGFDEFNQICVNLLKNCIIYLFGSWENVRNNKKMCFSYYFQQHNQTLENIFQTIF